MFLIERAAWTRLEGYTGEEPELLRLTSYRDQRAAFEYQRYSKSQQARTTAGAEAHAKECERLKALVKRSLLRRDPDGSLWVPSGKAAPLAEALGDRVEGDAALRIKRFRPFAWHRKPTKVLRDYQVDAVGRLLAGRHSAVALPPGTGKTLVILHLVRDAGLPAVVFSPSTSIVRQTYREFVDALGKKRVGMYGDGKKDLTKPVTIATTQSLLRVQGDAERFFRAKTLIAGDESHTLAADAMSQICLELLGDAPYRFFLSGSQDRHDGLRPLLDGVIGEIVLTMTVEEAVGRGALVPQRVRMLEVRNGAVPKSSDPGRATREVLYASKAVNEQVGAMINEMVALGRPTLVLVDELPQFAALLPYLRYPARFAHGCADKARLKAAVPPDQWESDPLELADRFNALEFPVLVGTSCLGTGVDIRATQAGFYLKGGKAENDMRQACGRFMRLFEGKEDVWVFDVDVLDGDIVHRHAEERLRIWHDIYPDVMRVRV